MSCEEEEGHIRFLQEGDSTVLSEEGKEEVSFIETHPGFSNMADNDTESVEADNEKSPGNNEDDDDDDDDDEEEEEDEIDEAEKEKKRAQALEDAETERLLNIEQAKSMINLIPKSFLRTRSNVSPIWKIFFIPVMRDPNLEGDLKRLDPQAHEMLVESKKPDVYIYVCKLCYDTATTSLNQCFKRNSSLGGPGNLPAHLATTHKDASAEYGFKPMSAKKDKQKRLLSSSDKSDNASPPKQARQESSQVSTSCSAIRGKSSAFTASPPAPLADMATAVSVSSSITNSFSHYDSPNIQCRSSLYQVGTAQLVEQFKVLHHDFITFNNIPVRAGTSHDCPEFKELMKFAMKHGAQIRNQSNLIMGTKQFNNFRMNRFTSLLAAIKKIVDEDRTWYKEKLKKHVPFLTIGQDVWDSKQKEALGVTAFWYSPTRKKYYIFPVGLQVVEDKKADPTARQTLKLLELCGIKKNDIYRAANDTTNTSLAIGRLLTADGKQGTCAMHVVQLAIVHATGMAQRREQGKIVDEFPQCEDLRKKAHAAASYLMEKRAKARYKEFHKLMVGHGRAHSRIAMPNSTRAAGILIQWESLIKEKFNLVTYWQSNVKAKELTEEEFYLIAQMCSVLYPIGLLVKLVQTDRPGAIAYTYFFIFRTWVTYLSNKKWYVPETRKSEHPEEVSRWDGSYQFPPRRHDGVPIKDIASDGKKKKKKFIPLNPVARGKLNPHAKRLLDRLCKEMINYGVTPTNDRMLAMACNPLTATLGMEELDFLHSFILQNQPYKELIATVLLDHQKTAMDVLVQQIELDCDLIIPNNDDNRGEQNSEVRNDDDAEEEEIDEMEELRRNRAKEKSVITTEENDWSPAYRQVHSFFNQPFDPRSAMPVESHKLVGVNKFEWIEKFDIIVEHFDVFKWWETIGKNSFPLIYPIAIRILSLPDSNGNQERTFSAATWMDGKLNSRQNDMTFQMKVLLYKNQGFLEENKKEVIEENRKAAAARTKALLESSTALMDDSDIDDELEGCMDAFECDDDTV
jgi:hypothetical protein